MLWNTHFSIGLQATSAVTSSTGRYAVTPLGSAAASVRYSPSEVVKIEKNVIAGTPDISRITTSHIEKQNHTLRMHCRRLTRLTNAFSKKIENFEAAVALNFAYYNFCKSQIHPHDTRPGRWC